MEPQFQPCHFIDKATFKNWTDAWKAAGSTDYRNFFIKDGVGLQTEVQPCFQTKAWLPNECVLYFLSTVGIVTVKVRFGIDNNNQFRIILYGVDQKNQLITPYYCLQTCYMTIKQIEEMKEKDFKDIDDPVSKSLAKKWILNWLDTCDISISRKMFMVYFDEILEGYNYPFREILDAFQPAISDLNTMVVNLYFALHIYPRRNADGEIVPRKTFGIIFQAGLREQSGTNKKSAESNLYFDVTTPCPQTC